MTEPTLAQLQDRIKQLEAEVAAAKAKNSKTKEIEMRVEMETGNFQIRRLTPKSINLPTYAVRWIIEHTQQILQFFNENKNLLAEKEDSEEITQTKIANRLANLETENPVVRRPRAENKTETA